MIKHWDFCFKGKSKITSHICHLEILYIRRFKHFSEITKLSLLRDSDDHYIIGQLSIVDRGLRMDQALLCVTEVDSYFNIMLFLRNNTHKSPKKEKFMIHISLIRILFCEKVSHWIQDARHNLLCNSIC